MIDLETFWTDARAEMDRHGLTDWKLVYSATRGRALGTTAHGLNTITLSAPHIETGTRAQGWDTVLHEIAHALCDVNEKHGPTWKRTARRLGANPWSTAHSSPSVATDFAVVGTCPAGHTYGRSQMPAKGRAYLCPKCSKRNLAGGISWKRNTGAVTPTVRAAVAAHGAVKVKAVLRVGATVRIVTPGVPKWDGKTGTVYKTGRTLYTVKVPGQSLMLKVPATCVTPV
jgi:predicted SprT family Zn-dependent metalloprotease